MTAGKIDHLIINSPYQEPRVYWKRDERTGEFFKESARRPAGYVVANPESTSLEDPGRFIPIELVEAIRPRVKRWREAGYPGALGTTRKLLKHWWISNSAATCADSFSVNWPLSRLSSG